MVTMTPDELVELGLEPNLIELHQRRIQAYLKNAETNKLRVKDCCRVENGGIIPFSKLQEIADKSNQGEALQGFAAFVPAAGAASRYFQPLVPLIEALEHEDQSGLEASLRSLASSDCEHWALPLGIKACLQAEQPSALAMQHREELLDELSRPKALQPAVLSGESFLELKRLEHRSIQGLAAQVFVVPIDQEKSFKSQFEAHADHNDVNPYFFEQGPKLSTIRFRPDGSPFRDEEGKLSPVPAGHGTLAQIIPAIRDKVPNVHSVLIRNIDNVIGNNIESIDACHTFLKAHQWLLSQVQQVRTCAKQGKWQEGQALCEAILNYYGSPLVPSAEFANFAAEFSSEKQIFWKVLVQVFHCSIRYAQDQIKAHGNSDLALIHLLNRPVNSLGQVPNSGKDVGGTPVFTETDGVPLSICLEVPHATDEDKQVYLSNPEKATHFNPVFVASEIVASESYDLEKSPFWILARKQYGRTEVIYHETVLYELLGNSILANSVFPEIPRSLFHPHKSLADSAGRSLKDWIE